MGNAQSTTHWNCGCKENYIRPDHEADCDFCGMKRADGVPSNPYGVGLTLAPSQPIELRAGYIYETALGSRVHIVYVSPNMDDQNAIGEWQNMQEEFVFDTWNADGSFFRNRNKQGMDIIKCVGEA